ncbi:molybdopterin converting factor subunit 1 [Bartonella tamiae]|uniref:Molybdopterin synthase sulfur carrier subunit n=1 Tax=Bartonella tamiae Th239 TaxID=1094558 RepID=J1JZX1_9HYPH|nr:molybdopterin converting factor subunit 1 [Bartonella tamiae]EJF90687.1 molybdopterin converting factor, subunit 1 [Bartonella tamiae Th239]EJF93936.1 molybdopterin converting factor, subunit 1 [Bartonella tamiae Th307]
MSSIKDKKIRLRYFAWIRERIGYDHEDLSVPETVQTVHELLNYLAHLGENYACALSSSETIYIALNQEQVGYDHAIKDNDEIAIFPPMTGG